MRGRKGRGEEEGRVWGLPGRGGFLEGFLRERSSGRMLGISSTRRDVCARKVWIRSCSSLDASNTPSRAFAK